MSINKQDIIKHLRTVAYSGENKDIVDSGRLKNINIFGNEIDIDVVIPSPVLHAKKKLEVDISKAIHAGIDKKAKVKVKFDIVTPEQKPSIKGSAIPGIKNIIAVASGKGGVGKSTVTSNLAISLAQMGFKVGVLDADVYGPSIPIMFDVDDEKPLAVKIDGETKMKPVENHGVKMLSLGFFTQVNQAVVWRGAMATKALKQLIRDADWGELDFLLLDLPPGTGDIHLSLIQEIPITGAVVVSTPQAVALADAKKGVAMFKMDAINVPVLGLIENMAYFTPEELPNNKYYIFGKEGAKNLANHIETPFLGDIPLVQSIREGGDIGRPAALNERSPIQLAFKEITKKLIQSLVERNENLPATEAVRITNMAGCSAVK